jgi:hypothetical protein
MSLRVVSHTPSINESGVFRNAPIQIYFNQPIEPSTITWDVMSVNDNYSFSTCVGQLSPIWASGINLSGVTSGMAFTPSITLLPNTEYSVYIYAAPNSVLAKDKSEIKETYSYNFITGTGYYDTTGNAGVPSGVSVNTYTVDLSGLTYLEELSINDVFGVYTTLPKNQSPNVSGLGLAGQNIIVTFTGNIATPSGQLGDYITITEEAVL